MQPWTVRGLKQAFASGATSPTALVKQALANTNSNAGHNTYVWRDEAWTLAEAQHVEATENNAYAPLWGLPVAVKDCFDLAGSPMTCGVKFYRDLNGIASQDSWLVARLRSLGAVITGKTHLHPLAYGVTGENPEFGDCVQPGRPDRLTGGSSSGSAASILEGSAVAAIGTDTGGSVRVPAALCGLAGYRSTLGRGDWSGAGHLAQSFDTMGWLFRDLEDAPLLGSIFAPENPPNPRPFTCFATIDTAFLNDCESAITVEMETCARELEALGLRHSTFDAEFWEDAFEIYAPIQAWEAARIHAGHFEHFAAGIRERLEWGAHIGDAELALLRERHSEFRARVDAQFAEHQLLILPASPVAALLAGADNSQARARILRYTTPFSLAGVPVVTVPYTVGGMQIASARETDESLLELTRVMGKQRKLAAPSTT